MKGNNDPFSCVGMYRGQPVIRYVDENNRMVIRHRNEFGEPDSVNLIGMYLDENKGYKLPNIKPYIGEDNTSKYMVMRRLLNSLIKAGLTTDIFLDLCCLKSDTSYSTAGLALDMGFTVLAYGNDISKMTPRSSLKYLRCPDVTKMHYIDSPPHLGYGDHVAITCFDPCVFIETQPKFIEEAVEHSDVVIWFISNASGRLVGTYGCEDKMVYGKTYPIDVGSLDKFTHIIKKYFTGKGYNVYIKRTEHSDYIIVITKLVI